MKARKLEAEIEEARLAGRSKRNPAPRQRYCNFSIKGCHKSDDNVAMDRECKVPERGAT